MSFFGKKSTVIGVFPPDDTLSYGIDVITPAVIDKPELSPSGPESSDGICDLCEYLEDLDPLVLLVLLGTSRTGPPSSGLYGSCGLSLYNFRPKKDLPPEVCRDLLSPGELFEGIA